jgi:hypothetical protein
MRVALVITVKNEARLLRQNVFYHLRIGIERVYVYFDGSTDNGQKLIDDIEGVETSVSVSSEKYKHLDYLEKFCTNIDRIHTARQCLNTYDAQMKCRDLGIDWLISLDADELFLTDYKNEMSLSDFFESLRSFDVVQFETLEVLAKQMTYDKVMCEETQFKIQKKFKNRFNRIYFSFYNPYNQESMLHSYWLGHNMGKIAIRVDSYTCPKNVHRYVTIDKTPLNFVIKGYLLHYHLYDFRDFLKKYKNFEAHPNMFLSGNNIGTLKTLWRDMVNDAQFDNAYLKAYFKKYLLIDSKKQKQLHYLRYLPFIKRKIPAVVEVFYPKQVLEPIKQHL